MEPVYQINENATYEKDIRALQDTDSASATVTFNPLFKTMINNTHAVKKEVEAVRKMVKSLDVVQIDDYSAWEPPEYPVFTNSFQAIDSPQYSRSAYNGMWNPSMDNSDMLSGTLTVSDPAFHNDTFIYIRNYTFGEWNDWLRLDMPLAESSSTAILLNNAETFSLANQSITSVTVRDIKTVQIKASILFNNEILIPAAMSGMAVASVADQFRPSWTGTFNLLKHVFFTSSSQSAQVALNAEVEVYMNANGSICLVSTSEKGTKVPADYLLHISGSYQSR